LIPCEAAQNRLPESSAAWSLGEFVGDSENVLVSAAAHALLAPEPRYNPLVFCGPTGVGKSLLLHVLAQRWREEHPQAKVIAISGADFARTYAHAIQTDTVGDHRARLTRASLLAFDGLEEFIKKPGAQQELIHTLDAALAEGVRVLVASRESLSPSGPFLPGLASRLSGGLVIPLAPPGTAARQAILARLTQDAAARWSVDALETLSTELCGTAVELRQAVHQISQEVFRHSATVDATAVHRFLEERTEQRRPTVTKIASRVAKRFRLKAADLQGKTRRREVVQARGVARLLARRLTGASYEAVGRHFGGRDHSTVMHACRRIAEQVKSDPTLQRTVEELASPWAN
jgi:chromosomal replication initiator protein